MVGDVCALIGMKRLVHPSFSGQRQTQICVISRYGGIESSRLLKPADALRVSPLRAGDNAQRLDDVRRIWLNR